MLHPAVVHPSVDIHRALRLILPGGGHEKLVADHGDLKAEVIRALGRIGYPQSVAYLKYVVENYPAAELRDLATASIRQIDPRAINAPASALFYQLGEKYYYHDKSMAPQEGAPIDNIWFWDANAGRLARAEVDPAYFNELMCMRCGEWSLKSEDQFKVYQDILDVFVYNAAASIRKNARDAVYSFAFGDVRELLEKGIEQFTYVAGVNVKEARRRIADLLIDENRYCF